MESPNSSIPWTWSQQYTNTVDAFEADAANLLAQSPDFWDFLGVKDISVQSQNKTPNKTIELKDEHVESMSELWDFMSLDDKPEAGQFLQQEALEDTVFQELDDILLHFSPSQNFSYLESMLENDLNPPHDINVPKTLHISAIEASPIYDECKAKRDCGLFGFCPFDGLAHPSQYLGSYFSDNVIQIVKPLPKRVLQLRGEHF